MLALPTVRPLRMAGGRRVVLGLLLVSVPALVACQGNRPDTGRDGGRGSAMPDAVAGQDATRDDAAIDEPATAPDLEAGTVSVWDAVVWRNKYLARRGQHGIIVGTVGSKFVPPAVPVVPGLGPITPGIAVGAGFGSAPGPSPIAAAGPSAAAAGSGSGSGSALAPTLPVAATGRSPDDLIWLIDDNAGNGALGIRVQFKGTPPVAGERVAVAGAWMLDSARQWYWKVDGVTLLPGAPLRDLKEPPSVPGMVVAAGPAPAGTRMVSLARDNDLIYFQVVGVPKHPGDGWKIADELGNPPVAILMLPGEQPSYGSLDLRTADERWNLRRGVTYWLRIGRIRRSTVASTPWTAIARTAPVRER